MTQVSIPTTFSIDFVDGLEKVSDLISRAKARIYYKGGNRNGTWITEEFAERLNKTIPHVPIVATYNEETGDFEDHVDDGRKKAYGFVPSNPQTEWITDESGKEYFTAEVYLWTGYWPEAAKIINKSQSMELDKNSIVGDFKVVNGDYFFVYQAAAFKGLCALGDAVMPCFENSAFYSLDKESQEFFQSINKMNEKNPGGGNTNMDENKDTSVVEEEVIVDVNTENFEMTAEELVEETPAEEVNTSEATATTEEAPATFEVEGEEMATETNVEMTYDTLAIETTHEEIISNEDGSTSIIQEAGRQTISITTYYELQEENRQLKEQVAQLTSEVAALSQYKAIVIKQEKMDVVDQFKKKLSDEEISEFVESLDNYTTDELRTKLSVVLSEKILNDNTEPQAQTTNFVSILNQGKSDGIVAILKRNKR